MCCELKKYMRTIDCGRCRKPYRNLSSHSMPKASVSLPWCSCVPSVNLIYCCSLHFAPKFPHCQVGHHAAVAPLSGAHGQHSPPGCFCRELGCQYTARFWHCPSGLPVHQFVVASLCPHGLLYAAFSYSASVSHADLLGRGCVIIVSSGKGLYL